MTTANPSQLFLLADHIKLSLLERQRAVTLNLEPNSQDGQISRSLESLNSGIEAVEAQLEQDPDADLSLQLTRLRAQYADLSAQFSNNAPPTTSITLTHPNNPSLSPDFAAARSKPPASTTGRAKPSPKSVRFTDDPSSTTTTSDEATTRAALFPYRDDPTAAAADAEGPPDHTGLSNQQVHAYHASVLREQDEQLDRLGASIGRQRELSIQIGDELDSQAVLLDDVDEGVERHQSQLDRARGRLKKVGRRARENWSLTTIVVLIVVLVLLIVVTK